jgi:hypothetical protein
LLIPFRLLSTHQFSTSLISDSLYHLTSFTFVSQAFFGGLTTFVTG